MTQAAGLRIAVGIAIVALGAGHLEAAVAVFRLNAETFPEAANTWDSLAEAIMKQGDYETAIDYYRKSLQLNPSNVNAERMIEKMRGR